MSFKKFLDQERQKPYFKEIFNYLEKINPEIICPKVEDIFRSFSFFEIEQLKIVILGQDPYHQKNVADGLAFSTQNKKTPASLKNIFKELKEEYLNICLNTNNLEKWAKQGILLQNIFLTTEIGKPKKHSFLPWNIFTKNLFSYINKNSENVIFILWGNEAKKMKSFIDQKKHFVLESAHPSPFSFFRGFYKNNHFIEANKQLEKLNKKVIDWNLF